MPKILKLINNKIGDKIYYKYMINIPPEIIRFRGFSQIDEFSIKSSKTQIILNKLNKELSL